VARSKALEFLQKTVLNIIFPGGEYATNLIIANVETLSHDDGNSHSFSLDGSGGARGGGGLGKRGEPPLTFAPGANHEGAALVSSRIFWGGKITVRSGRQPKLRHCQPVVSLGGRGAYPPWIRH